VKARARLGQDVVAEKEAAAAKANIPTLGQLVPTYLAVREAGEDRLRKLRPSSLREVRRYLTVAWKPLHRLAVDQIKRSDVEARLTELARTSGKTAADCALVALSTLLAWAIDKHYLEQNVTIGIKPHVSQDEREEDARTLDESELVEVWRATGDDDDYSKIIRLLILTGQRRNEIGRLRWEEFDREQGYIALPPARIKNRREHILPLGSAAVAILKSVPRKKHTDYVFGPDGLTGFARWSTAKEGLDARIATARRKAGKAMLKAWTVHDLRRTFSTRMNELGLADPHIIDALLNHISGYKSGVRGTYNHAKYIAAKRTALDAWGAHIASLAGKGQKIRAKPRAKELA
jgi:integrase